MSIESFFPPSSPRLLITLLLSACTPTIQSPTVSLADVPCKIVDTADHCVFDFTGMDLEGVNFSGLNLAGAIFEGVDATRANFEKAILANGKFEGVNLTEANLRGAHFENANLKGANLTGATLSLGTNFDETSNLCAINISGIKIIAGPGEELEAQKLAAELASRVATDCAVE